MQLGGSSVLLTGGSRERRSGHIVNMSSLAGKAAVPYSAVYAATKHGVVGLSYSLRAELHGTGVGVSVICPGYVAGAGMFAEGRHHTSIPRGSGAGTTPRKVMAAVIRAIERDMPDVVVSGALPKLSDVALAVSPRFALAMARRTGAYDLQRREAEAQAEQGGP